MEMDIGKFIIEKALIIVPALWIIGSFLKHTPAIRDWIIPWILTGLGIVGAVAIMGVTAEAVVQGILVAGMAVLGHQLLKQTMEKS